MLSSDSSNWNLENKRLHTALKAGINCCRFLLGVVFIASGFVKANDPWGTYYKFLDYLEAGGVPVSLIPMAYPFLSALVLGICEFVLGIHLFFGIRRKVSALVAISFLSFMTPLTLWLALTDPIADCGCFGDAVVLSNWETFFKNVVLLAAAVVLYKGHRYAFKLVTYQVDWLISLYSIVFVLFFSLYCIHELPVFDFRPYAIGADIRKGMEVPEGEHLPVYETTFVYAKEGRQQVFTIDSLPTDTAWTFVESKTLQKEAGYEPPIHDFSITLQEDGTDVTDEVLDDGNYTFLLVAPYLAQADDSSMDLINEIYDYCVEYGYRFFCVTASSDEDIAEWQENTGAEYPFARMDDVTLKTIVRSHPGLVLLQRGVVLNKWSTDNLPDEYQLGAPLDELPLGQVNRKSVSRKIGEVLGWFFLPLLLLSLADLAWLARRRKQKK